MTTCFVLFSLNKSKKISFDPALCGIFLDVLEAKKAQDILAKDKLYLSFILELPLSQTSEDWMNYVKDYLVKKTILETSNITNNKILHTSPIQVEYKITRKKVHKDV